VRMTHNAPHPDTLQQVIAWKSDQYKRSELTDLFAYGWTVDLLQRIQTTAVGSFAGSISELWAGDRLVAAHFGMRSDTVWHWWFPAYDPEYARHSPGMVLLVDAIQHARSMGITMLDMGKGKADYKDRLCNAAIPLHEGCVTIPSWRTYGKHAAENMKQRVRGSWLHTLLKKPLRTVGQWERDRRFR